MASNMIILVEEDDVASTSGPRPTSSTLSYSDLTYIGQGTSYIPPSGVSVAQAPFDTPISNQTSEDRGEHEIVASQGSPAVAVEVNPRKPQKPVSEKDIERRRKNTISARKSRKAKNDREIEILAAAIGLTEKNKELKIKLETAKKRLSTAQNRVATAKNRVATLENRVATTENKVATAENRVATLENRMATAENRLATTENRLASAETRIGELLQRLAYSEGQERK